jgi:predicted RNase H-like HicB family nuclease
MDLLVILTSRGFDAVQKKKKLQTQVYTIETETYKKSTYYIIRVNELPGICTDAEDLNEGMEGIKEAIACAIEIYLESGEPIDT